MTFKHRLSVRLALLKDVLPLVSVVALLAACEEPSPVGPTTTTYINVSTIVTTPDSVTLEPGESLRFGAYGRTPTRDSVAITVTWQAVGGGVISADGLYTASGLQGDYAVVAKLVPVAAIGAPNMALPVRTSVVHVDPVAQIVVVPASTSVVTGGTQRFAAYGRRSAGDSVAMNVVWSATGGTISPSGFYTAGATPGGYVVNASADGLIGTATVTASSVPVASVVVSPASVNVSVGSTQQLSAVAKDVSGNVLPGRTVTWATSSSAIATVSPSGVVSGVAAGSATLTATSEGKSGTAAVTVTNLPVASVMVSPSPASVYLGASARLGATVKDANGNPLSGRAVAWTTSNGAVAPVDSTGLITGIALGTATITATSEGQTGTTTVTVSSVPVASVVVAPSGANILVGDTVQLTATTQDAAGTVLAGRAITWSSSNPSVAAVSSSGLATGLAAGTATLTATSEGKNASAAVTVANIPVASVVISPATALVLVGASVQLTASAKDAAGTVLSGRTITWASSAPATATVSSTGLVTGVAASAVTITATSEGRTGSAVVTVNPVPVASVTISPATVSAAVGQAVQLTATPRDASGNPLSGRMATWATSNAAVATVNASGQVTVGVVTGVAAGSATITATIEGKSATSIATVTTATPPPPPPPGALPVFPGAEGYGTTTPAGRGGQVIHVTNLNDAGPGSLRYALATPGPRTIVFDVSGQINLSHDLCFGAGTLTTCDVSPAYAFVTVAGQTAPSPGITLAGAGINIRTSDVLIQHLRIRPGFAAYPGRDGIVIQGVSGGPFIARIVIDHVSVSWTPSTGKNMNTNSASDVTFSNCINAEAFPYGFLITGQTTRLAVLRSLFAHNIDRNPETASNTSVTWANTIIYGPGNITQPTGLPRDFFGIWRGQANGTPPDGPAFANVIGNVAIRNNAPTGGLLKLQFGGTALPRSVAYTTDNIFPDGIVYETGTGFSPASSPAFPLPSPLTLLPASSLENALLPIVGARPADRDAVDARLINETRTRTGVNGPLNEAQVGGYPTLAQNVRVLAIPANQAGIRPSGYSVLEEDVLFPMAAQVEGRAQ